MNKFLCICRLTKDVELNTTNSGTVVAKFSIAVDRKFKNENGEKQTDFFNCVAWKGLAETISKYCKKGSKIFLSGEVQNRSYEDGSGTKKYITEIIANEVEFLDCKKDSNDNEEKQETVKVEPVDDSDLPF